MSDALAIVPRETVLRPVLPVGWDFERADREFDNLIKAWRRLTVEVLEKAFRIYLALSAPGQRVDLDADATRLPTWAEWCDQKGANRTTFYRHFIKLGWLQREEAETPLLPSMKYRVLYADPPWRYSKIQHGHEENKTVLENHYPTMADEDLLALPVADIAADEAVLFCWATAPRLPFALEVLAAWGFDYKENIVWDKVLHNVGHYISVRHEHLLIATRGSCMPDVKKLHDSVVSIERTEHSEKPAHFRDLIDKMYPKGKRVELFARKAAPGWDVWGNEVAGKRVVA